MRGGADMTYPQNSEDMRIDIQSPLVHTGRQGRIQTLRKALRDNQLAWNLLELHVGLKCLRESRRLTRHGYARYVKARAL